MATFTAFNGVKFYDRVGADGTSSHGPNEDDGSIVGLLTNIHDGQRISDYLTVNRLDPDAVARAFQATGKGDGYSFLNTLATLYPAMAAWCKKYEAPKPVVPTGPFLIPQTVEPNLPYHSIAMADGEKWAPDDKGWGLFWRDHDKWQRLFP